MIVNDDSFDERPSPLSALEQIAIESVAQAIVDQQATITSSESDLPPAGTLRIGMAVMQNIGSSTTVPASQPPDGAPSNEGAALLLTFSPHRPLECLAFPSRELLPRCHLVLEADRASLVATLVHGPHDAARTSLFVIDDRGAGGRWHGPLPPFDLPLVPALRLLPQIDGASAVVQLVLTDSLCGTIPYSMTVVDGRVARLQPGFTDDPEVYVRFSYESYLRFRAGQIEIGQAIRNGDLGGDFGKLQMFSGLTQSLPFQVVYGEAFSSPLLLADYCGLVSSDSYRMMAASVRATLGLGVALGQADDSEALDSTGQPGDTRSER